MNANTNSRWTKIVLGVLFLALSCLFWFNFETTRQSFRWMIGNTYLVTFLAVAISLLDAAGVYMVTVGISRSKEIIDDVFYWLLLLAWVLSTFSDIALTYFWGRIMIYDAPALVSGRIDLETVKLIPFIIAFSEFGMRVPLVISLGRLLSRGIGKVTGAQRQIQPGSPPPASMQPRPVPTGYTPLHTGGAGIGPKNDPNHQKRRF